MKNWYYAQNGERKGPVDQATIQNLYQSGQIAPEDLVWEEGMADWVKAETILTKSPLSTPSPLAAASPLPPPSQGAGQPLPDYGDLLCWGIALCLIPCLGFFAIVGLIVLHIMELLAVRKGVEEGRIQKSQYSEIHPALMGLGIFCCSIVFYPLFMHWRNETKLFKPQPHAVWFSITVLAIGIIVGIAMQFMSVILQAMGNMGQ